MKVYLEDITTYKRIKPDNIFQDQIKEYQDEILNKQNQVAWTMLYYILKEEYNIEDFKVHYKENNKPYINGLYFNISHSYHMVAIIISDEECGIDIECLNNNKNIEKLKRRFNIVSDTEFFKQWTRKEAYLKKIGTGIKISSLFEEVKNITTEKVEDKEGNSYFFSYC